MRLGPPAKRHRSAAGALEGVVESVLSVAPPALTPRRTSRGALPLVLGLVCGIATGAVMGLLLAGGRDRRGETAEGRTPAGGRAAALAILDRGRSAFERGRTAAIHRQPGDAKRGAAAPAEGSEPPRGLAGLLRTRWQEAVAAGKEEGEAVEEELRRRYLKYVKRG